MYIFIYYPTILSTDILSIFYYYHYHYHYHYWGRPAFFWIETSHQT
jgi:hypothetical protein